ncbi:MAG: hypothetical protein SO575_00230, partial [Sodaliphilus sp.]|nr:hypothetical protein [Sodaliphilus sp.]
FGDATALGGVGGVGGGAWLIHAPALNHTCHSTNDKCEALASLKGCFLCFLFQCPQHLSTEPRFSLAWCFASFGIFDACLGCCFQEVKKLRRYLCLW